ncbi:LysR substrate-binding domain-containing protein [Pseudoroseomonas wenyumeiae]
MIRDGLSEGVLEAVADGRAHIGLTVQPVPSSKLHYRPLCEDALAWSVVWTAPWPCRSRRPGGSSPGIPVAMAPASSVRMMTDAAFLQAGWRFLLYECSFLGTAGHLVGQGLGITAIPRLALPLLSAPDLFWRPLKQPDIRRQIGMVVRTSHSLPPPAERMVALLEQMKYEGLFEQ